MPSSNLDLREVMLSWEIESKIVLMLDWHIETIVGVRGKKNRVSISKYCFVALKGSSMCQKKKILGKL